MDAQWCVFAACKCLVIVKENKLWVFESVCVALKRAFGLLSLAVCLSGVGLLGLGRLIGLLGQEDGLNVGQDAALRDGDAAQQLVELLVVADRQLQVTRDDSGLLVVAGGVSGQLEDLGGEVLEDGGQVNRSAGADALSVVSLAQQPVDAADWKLEARPGRARLGLGASLAGTFTATAT